MNVLDIVVLTILALSALLGFTRGLVREALGVCTWIAAAWCTVAGFQFVQPFARQAISDSNIADPVGFIGLFAVLLTLFSLVTRLISGLVRGSLFGGIDRSLGAVFGVLRGIAILVIAYILGGSLFPVRSWPPNVVNARSLPYMYACAHWTIDHIPADVPSEYRPRLYAPPTNAQPDGDESIENGHNAPAARSE